ncbi:MAG: hypothetical protein NUV45_02630 [Tepidanaerobacteraceae bacterium]|nr:hypothetical protein [Tepidanaerobacteraceae bacterium]
MEKNARSGENYFYHEHDTGEGKHGEDFGRKTDLGAKDIIAMIIAAFELVLPPLLMMFGAVLLVYFALKLMSGY